MTRRAPLLVCVLFVSMAVACGGQGGGQSQDSDPGGPGQQEQAGKENVQGEGKNKGRERKSMEGVVAKLVTNEDRKSKIRVRPEEGDAVAFKFKPEEIKVEINGEEATQEDIEQGQRAEVRYVTVVAPKKDVEQNIALSMKLEAVGGGDGDGDQAN